MPRDEPAEVEFAPRAVSTEHWASKDGIRLFLRRKHAPGDAANRPPILFIHGSSMASEPTFDLEVPETGHRSVLEEFAAAGYDCWCLDNEGYGRSDKSRDIPCDIANGAADIAAADRLIRSVRGDAPLRMYGISSGALKAARFAQENPGRVARLALDAFVWTGEGSPTLAERRRKLPAYMAAGNRRPIDRAFVHSIFTRDHPGTAENAVVDAFADAILALDDSVPIGTYIDMCLNLPVVAPEKVLCPTIILRGEYDGIAGLDDLIEFFRRLPNPDKQFAVMPGIAHASFQQKNHRIARHILAAFFAQPEPTYRSAPAGG
jgi:pimeloyl-ACP methyl ester carboxylesterase